MPPHVDAKGPLLWYVYREKCFVVLILFITVTGGEGNSVQVYQCVPGKLLQTLKAHSAPVLSVCWNRDESFLVSSDRLGAVVLWKRALFVH